MCVKIYKNNYFLIKENYDLICAFLLFSPYKQQLTNNCASSALKSNKMILKISM